LNKGLQLHPGGTGGGGANNRLRVWLKSSRFWQKIENGEILFRLNSNKVPKVSQDFSQPSMFEELSAILRLSKLALV